MEWTFTWTRNDPSLRNIWGRKFRWTELHKTSEELRPYRFNYDKIADKCLEKLNSIWSATRKTNQEGQEKDLFALLRDHATEDETLQQMWSQVNAVPEWVDWEQIERGQEVFYRYGLANLSALPFQSLLGGMGAGRIAEVLARTGGFSPKVARRRLFETTQFVLEVTSSIESIKPGGIGHASSVRVRLLHAAVRQHILKLARTRIGYWDMEEFGIPANDLDCLLTLCAFSTVIVYIGLPRQGIWLSDQEKTDYIALWRLVGYYLGTPVDAFETVEKALAMTESLLLCELQPTETSRMVTQNILLSLDNNHPFYASKGFMETLVWWMNGKELSKKLGMNSPDLRHWSLVFGYCFFLITIYQIQKVYPAFERRNVQRRRRLYYRIIMDEKRGGLGKESKFNFQYAGENVGSPEINQIMSIAGKERGIQTLAYVGLAFAAVLISLLALFGFIVFNTSSLQRPLSMLGMRIAAFAARPSIMP